MADDSPQQPKLSDKHQKFVDCYVGEARFNKSKAALLAGYSEKSSRRIGYGLYKDPLIRARIDQEIEQQSLAKFEILSLLAEEASQTNEAILASIDHLDDKVAASVASSLVSGRTSARQSLAKAHGLFTENLNISGDLGITYEIVGVNSEELG